VGYGTLKRVIIRIEGSGILCKRKLNRYSYDEPHIELELTHGVAAALPVMPSPALAFQSKRSSRSDGSELEPRKESIMSTESLEMGWGGRNGWVQTELTMRE
jgi:hypothetical protein